MCATVKFLFVALGHKRQRGPKLALLAKCSLPEAGTIELSFRSDNSLDVLTGGSAALFFFTGLLRKVLPILRRIEIKLCDITAIVGQLNRVRLVGSHGSTVLLDRDLPAAAAVAQPAVAPVAAENTLGWSLNHWQQVINAGIVALPGNGAQVRLPPAASGVPGGPEVSDDGRYAASSVRR